MRNFLVILIALLVMGCASGTRLAQICSVFESGRGIGSPVGLVSLDESLDHQLKSQLPEQRRSRYVCWYTSGTDLIAADRKDPSAVVSGYIVHRSGDSWVLSNQEPIILALPQAIE